MSTIPSANPIRRKLCKAAGATLVMIPIMAIVQEAQANANAAVRAQLKYQDAPKGDMSCATCLEFVPGKAGSPLGTCKVIPGDDEISPNGYCTTWNSM